jgi:hypothetical protein
MPKPIIVGPALEVAREFSDHLQRPLRQNLEDLRIASESFDWLRIEF